MTDEITFGPYRPEVLPAVVSRYLDAQRLPQGRAAVADAFAPAARVVDEHVEHVGSGAIREWLTNAANEFTYTTTIIGQADRGDERWDVLARLQGDFPGGVADLRFQFRVEHGRIAELIIEP